MPWQLCILLQTVLVAIGMVTTRVIARNKRLASENFVITSGVYVGAYAAVLACVPLLGHVDSSVLSTYWWRLVGGGFMFAIMNAWTYKMYVCFDAAIATIASTFNTVFSVIGAALFLNEDLNALQLVGALVLMLAVTYGILATHSKVKKAKQSIVLRGLGYTLLAALSFSVAIVNEKWLLEHMSVGSYAVYGIGGQFVMTLVCAVILQPKKLGLLLEPAVAGWSLLTGVLRGFGGIFFILTEVKTNNVALATVLANFRLIIVIFLGAWLLKEHQHIKQKLIAATASIGGMLIMFWK